uniref:Glyco_transf_41 domain-containing protein n=1 Tax=Angiostrongylus cantonensis TaxID=6313 RepID=A0A0K0CWJ7_ANGCA
MIALKSALRLPRGLSVEWVDGMRAQFTNVWLRDNSLHMRPSLIHLDLNPCPQRPGTIVHRDIGAMIWKEPLLINGTVWPHLQKIPSVVTVETRFGGARVSLVDSIAALKRMRYEQPLYFQFMLDNPIEYEHAFFKATHHLANVGNNDIITVSAADSVT